MGTMKMCERCGQVYDSDAEECKACGTELARLSLGPRSEDLE